MGGGGELDLLLVGDGQRKLFAGQGLLEDFYGTGLLPQWHESWLDLRKQMETDGKLYGFPRSVEVGHMSWYDELGERVGIEKPGALWTWEDFARLATDISYDVDGDGAKDFCLLYGYTNTNGMTGYEIASLELYTYQRALQGEAFSSPEFEALMDQFVQVYQSRALDPAGIPLFQERDAQLIKRVTESGWLITPDGYSYLNNPTLYADDPGYTGRGYAFALLKSAPHREAALDFLRGSLELCERRISACDITAYLNKNMPVCCLNVWGNGLVDAFAPDEKGELVFVRRQESNAFEAASDPDWMVSEQAFADYNFMRAHYIPATGEWYSVSKVMFEMLPQYFSGAITLDQITGAMDQRMRMMQGE